MKYDIFISYRREGGYDTAKHLYDLLVRDGYKVSFDIDTLRSGDFDTQLLTRIEQCRDFILIVDKHAFDRTLDPGFDPHKDWLRCELAHALKHDKNIIPVFLSGVSGFPEGLPKDIAGVAKKNGPEYNRYYFNDFYDTLKRRFLHKRHDVRKYVIVALLVLVAGFGGYRLVSGLADSSPVQSDTPVQASGDTDADKYYPDTIDTHKLFVKGLRNGVEYFPVNDPTNKGCRYVFKDGRVIDIQQIFYQTGMWFNATDESGELTSLPVNFGDVGYQDATHEVEYSDNEYLIGQCDIDGDDRDELLIAIRTQADRWLDGDFGVGVALNFLKLVGGRWELFASLVTDTNVHPVNVKIVNNNVYVYWLRYDEKFTLVGREFVSQEFYGRVFTKQDFK